MARAVIVLGLPASGKTTLVARAMDLLRETAQEPEVRATVHPLPFVKIGRVLVPGVWDGSVFQGSDRTDRVYMMPALIDCAKMMTDSGPLGCFDLLAEGERFSYRATLHTLFLYFEHVRFVVCDEPEGWAGRMERRGHTFQTSWLKGRRTLLANAVSHFSTREHTSVRFTRLNTMDDTENEALHIARFLLRTSPVEVA